MKAGILGTLFLPLGGDRGLLSNSNSVKTFYSIKSVAFCLLSLTKCWYVASNSMSFSSDIDECVVGTHNCFEGLVCVNMEGSFLCQKRTSCGPGYELKSDNKCQGEKTQTNRKDGQQKCFFNPGWGGGVNCD